MKKGAKKVRKDETEEKSNNQGYTGGVNAIVATKFLKMENR